MLCIMTMTNESILEHINNINDNGFTIIKNGIDIELVNKVICEFDEWASNKENNFKKFNKDRVCNFHIYSENTMSLVTNEYVNQILKGLFDTEQVIYSSLFFREGTAQHFHRDTPHFYTNPIDMYYGVWYSLEDIDVNAGPLKYYVGSHKLEDPIGYQVFNEVYKDVENKDDINIGSDYTCIMEYNKYIEDLSIHNNLKCIDESNYINKINKGDIIIWHPKLLHGGSNIIDEKLTRYSMVTHNVPINTQVFNAKHFFTKEPTQEYLKNEFVHKYINYNGINIVDHGVGPNVQKNYV